jgi:sigma-E factor negative regulatory protein RseC
MNTSECIEQKGIVEEVMNHCVRVRIQRSDACGHCSAKGMCNLGSDSDLMIESAEPVSGLKKGDVVGITMARSTGNKAILFGYFMPFMLLIVVLITLNSFGLREWVSGLISICALAPYYLGLYIFRKKLGKSITFAVHKIE